MTESSPDEKLILYVWPDLHFPAFGNKIIGEMAKVGEAGFNLIRANISVVWRLSQESDIRRFKFGDCNSLLRSTF